MGICKRAPLLLLPPRVPQLGCSTLGWVLRRARVGWKKMDGAGCKGRRPPRRDRLDRTLTREKKKTGPHAPSGERYTPRGLGLEGCVGPSHLTSSSAGTHYNHPLPPPQKKPSQTTNNKRKPQAARGGVRVVGARER